MQRPFESIEAAFQPLDHVGLIDGCQLVGHLLGLAAIGFDVFRAVLHSTVAGIGQSRRTITRRVFLVGIAILSGDQCAISLIEEFIYIGSHLIGAHSGVEQFGEMNFIAVPRFMLYVAACAAHHHLLQHHMPHLLIDSIDALGQHLGA